MIEDAELLRRYAEDRSEGAFAELVKRRVGLVYSVAVRQCGGDVHLAEDVTQKVFTDLARKAAVLAARPVLSGWLYRSAHFAASDVVRSERRRRAREEENQSMNEISTGGSGADGGQVAVDWEKLRPVLDEAMGELGDEDRDAVALRFFEGKSFGEIGGRLALSEEAARKRVSRGVGKLQGLLARRGVTSTEAALGLALANQAAAVVPAGLAASVTSGALAGAGLAGAAVAGGGLAIFMGTTKLTVGLIGAVTVGGDRRGVVGHEPRAGGAGGVGDGDAGAGGAEREVGKTGGAGADPDEAAANGRDGECAAAGGGGKDEGGRSGAGGRGGAGYVGDGAGAVEAGAGTRSDRRSGRGVE